MCGRFLFIPGEKEELLFDTFSIQNRIDLQVNYNVAPTQNSPVVTRNSPNKINMMKWGIRFSWMQGSGLMINARTETVMEKHSFRKLINNRCVVLTSGYYEWKKEGSGKTPYLIKLLGEEYTPIAGLYEQLESTEDGSDSVGNFLILTKGADPAISDLHERMPLLLDQELYDMWLDKGKSTTELIGDLSRIVHKLEYHQVSDRVNSIKNNDRLIPQSI